MARTWFFDGETMVYKTFSPESRRPRIQLIESAHRIVTPSTMRDREGQSIIDGIEFQEDGFGNPVGKPKTYWLRNDAVAFQVPPYNPVVTAIQDWTPIPAERIIHLFEPSRIGLRRGLPFAYPVLNDEHDLEDLQMLEMKAAKAAAEIANVVTNRTGEANTASSRRQKMQIQSQDVNGNATVKTNPLYYEVTMGGRTTYFVNGEKIEQFKSDRPSVSTQWYWDYLVRKICAGVGISAQLVMPFSLQGTVTRADLDIAAGFFRSRSAVMAHVMREIYIWVMGWAVKYDRALDGAPDDWYRVNIRPPRSPNVDVGRNSQAMLAELEAGTRTFQDICAELGHDWRDVLRQKAEEAAFIQQLSEEYEVPVEKISQLAKQSVGPSQPEKSTPEPAQPDQTETPNETALVNRQG
jgi:capsid protein